MSLEVWIMKSRTSSSKLRVFKKDLTRFAPIWAEYSVLLLIIYYFLLKGDGDLSRDADITLVLFGWINALYGFVCAVGLFGYLTDARECNTVHFFPIRREEYFLVHTLAGFLMALVPNAVFFLLNIPLASGNLIPLFLFTMLEFVFFYGLAIFCMFLTGRKFAAATLYALFNWLSLLIAWAVDVIYIPALPGVQLDTESFILFVPLVKMMSDSSSQEKYILIYAVVGFGLMIASLFLYRRRKLEYAGDFLAVKWLTPVFIVAVSIACGCVLGAFQSIFNGGDSVFFLLGIGLVVGYFTGMMLLRRTIKVFSLKSIGGAVALTAVIFLSIFVTELDLFGWVEYVPEGNQVSSVQIRRYSGSPEYEVSDPAVIADVLALHDAILDTGTYDPNNTYGNDGIHLTYKLKNGRTIVRCYQVLDQELTNRIHYYFSQPEIVLNVSTLEELKANCRYLRVGSNTNGYDNYEYDVPTGADLDAMLETLFRECEEGKVSPYRYDYTSLTTTYISLDYKDNSYFFIDVPNTATDTLAMIRTLMEKSQ